MPLRFGNLAFKPNTYDMREVLNHVIIAELVAHDASFCAYDPIVMAEVKRVITK